MKFLRSMGFVAALLVSGGINMSSASATVLTYDYTATISGISTTGTSVTPDIVTGLVVGQTASGSFSYDTAAAPYLTGLFVFGYSTGSNSITLPTGTFSGNPFPNSTLVISNNDATDHDSFVINTGEIIANTNNLISTNITLSDPTNNVFSSTAIPNTLSLSSFGSATGYVLITDRDANFNILGTERVDLTITAIAAVPEPTTWAMMILGFLGIGFLAYRKKSTLRFV